MKRTHPLYYLLLALLLLTGCNAPNQVTDDLIRAEAWMNEHPDSALNLLKGIEQPELQTREHHAHYALLYSQALDKNYIDLTSDSLINIAVDYYKDRDDVRAKFLSYYYQGRIYTNANNLTQATLAYMEAEQLVDELGDDFAAGLLYDQMGDIFQEYYDFSKALESYQYATTCYQKANKPLHKLYGMLSQSGIYKSMNKDTDSFHILYNILVEAKEINQTSVIRSCLGDLIILCLKMNKHQEAISFYNNLINNYSIEQMTSSLYANLSLLMAREKNMEKSQFYMNEAWKRAKNQSDSIHLYYISAQVEQLSSSYQKAFSDLEQSITLQNRSVRESLQQPILTTQMDFLRQKMELQKYKAQSEKQMRIIGVVLTILLAVAAVYAVSVYIKRQREKYLKQIRKQVARIELLKDEKNGMEEEVRKLNQLLLQGGELKDELMQAKGEWTRLEDIRALELYTRLRQDPSLYNPSADYDALLRWVDIASVRFAERLQESYPHLNVSEITLCCLVRMGYSPSQMAEILHVKIPTVNRYIYRICTSLELPNHKESFRQFIVAF
ncbi:MAG: hypothetical protein IJZ38_01450 [Bacteroides sp.]|nr:hypothetical protein [Bacteroides sp.]